MIKVTEQPFDPWQTLQAHERALGHMAGKYGATACFVGTMRDFNEGDTVHAMTLEHYPGMTERHLERFCREAQVRWPISETLIVHRCGELHPGDPIVLVAVWSAHRGAAFEACRFLIESLKHQAPFWKKERLEGRERWVEHNTPS